MPIYIVRWPNLSAALVRARTEEELVDILDQVGDPSACRWQVYSGPLFIDLDLEHAVKHRARDEKRGYCSEDDIVVEDVASLVNPAGSRLRYGPSGESGDEMEEKIIRWAFPNTAGVFKAAADHEADPGADTVRAAVKKDLLPLTEAHRKCEALRFRKDKVGEAARIMGTDPSVVERMFEAARKRKG